MTINQQLIFEILNTAISDFNNQETFLIKNDVSERCICSKFSSYIEKALAGTRFSEYIVDVEYNRGRSGKEYAAKKLNGRNIVVDLIVHKRTNDVNAGFDNLFCIEMKKGYKSLDCGSDIERLKMMTDDECGFCYKAGFMVLINRNLKEEIYELRINSCFYNAIDC